MEIFILVGVALIVVGPDKLPKLARDMAKFINDIKRTTSSITSEINNSLAKEELEKKLKLDENTNDKDSDNHNDEEHPPEDPLGNLTKKYQKDKTPLNDNTVTKEKSDV